MVQLEGDPFLTELAKLFEGAKTRGQRSIWLTVKRRPLTCTRSGKALADLTPSQPPYRCVLRATDGRRKISTQLSLAEAQKIQAAYLTLLKAHMDALKKRERRTNAARTHRS